MSKGKKIAIIISLVLVSIYGLGSYLFSKFTYPGTSVNGVSRNFVALDKAIFEPDTDAIVKVQGRDSKIVDVSGHDIDLVINRQGPERIDQNFLIWPIEIFQDKAYDVEFTVDYDRKKLERTLEKADILYNGPLPENAKVVADDQGAHVQKEDEGNHVDYSKLEERIVEAFIEGRNFVTSKDLFKEPEIRDDDPDLKAEAEKLNKILNVKVVYKMGDEDYVFGPGQMLEALDKSEDGKYSLNKDKVAKWVQSLANMTDTYGKKREFITQSGVKQTLFPGIYGWKINVKKTGEKLLEMINQGGDFETEPIYSHKAKARGELNDIGDDYIEVDLSKQKLWCFKDKKVVFTSLLKSGKANGSYETPVGVHMIWSREKDKKLTGNNLDGSEYNSEVKYWIPINYKGVGLHDADWVKYFGGTNYIRNGSHGCINLPLETAKFIYDNYSVGTPVPTYESSTNYSRPDKSF